MNMMKHQNETTISKIKKFTGCSIQLAPFLLLFRKSWHAIHATRGDSHFELLAKRFFSIVHKKLCLTGVENSFERPMIQD